MPTNYLRVDRDDLSGSAPPGTIEIRDPRPAPPIEQARPGSYKVLLDGTVIGALGDFQAVRVALAPGDHVVGTRAFGDESMIFAVRFTVEADCPDSPDDSRAATRSSNVFEGTSEIQQLAIARSISDVHIR